MKQFRTFVRVSAFLFLITLILFPGGVTAQAPTGSLRGLTTDPSGAAVVGAEIIVTDNATRAEYKTVSSVGGEFSVDNLNPGVYTVTVIMKGFRKSVFTDVKIIVSQIYDLAAKLEIGEVSNTVVVEAGQEVVETQSATVGASIVGRAITELPFTSRSTLDLATLMPGAATTGRARQTSFDGLPKGALNITYDGINAQDNLLKSNDGFFTVTRPSIDAVEEFSISTAANGAQESGQGAVQIKMETKRGGNAYHGGVWEYFRNDALNANYYFNNENGVPRQKQRLNQYGYKIGGPILKDRLFFFTDFDFYNSPQGRSFTRQILTPDAANGLFTYATTTPQTGNAWTTCVASSPRNNNGPACTVNLAQLAASKGFAYTTDPFIATVIGNVEAARSSVSTSTQFNPWLDNAVYNQAGKATRKFPDFRFDWQAAKNHQITAIYHYSKFVSSPDFLNNLNPFLPVAPFNKLLGSQISNRNQYTAAWRWNIGTTMSNELRFGLQTALVAFFPDEDASQYPVAQTNLGKIIVRPALNSGLFPGFTATANFQPFLAFNTQGRNTPLGTILDNYSWTKGRHSLTFGGDATEIRFHQFLKGQRLVQTANVGLSSVDPVNANFVTANFPGISSTSLTGVQQLFGVLTGRITSYSGTISVDPTKQQYVPAAPNLQQAKQHEFGIYAADSWRMRPTLTLSYGLRWEYQGSPYDQLNESFSLVNGFSGVFGVSGANNLFKPGTLTGSIPSLQLNNGRSWYNTDLHDFAPSVGLAWQPSISMPLLRNVFPGNGKTVFRAGYGITYTREGFNNFDSIAYGNPGIDGTIFANSVAPPGTGCSAAAAPGNLNAGCITINGLVNGSGLTSLLTNPAAFPATGTFQVVGFSGQAVNAFDPNLRTPRVQSWSVGIQRQLSQDTVIEVRYVGNHGTGLWRQENINEVNIFENGFLNEFNLAKANLAANIAGGCGTRFDPVAGCSTNALPIMKAAFTGVSLGSGFGSGSLVTFLNNNAAGSFANSLATTSTFMCNLAGKNAFPGVNCPAASPAVGPFPANLFVANPNASGTGNGNNTNNAGGAFRFYNGSQSTYNALQVEVRRRFSKGFQLAANYAFSKSLTNYYGDSSVNFVPFTTLRNKSTDKDPSPWDLRHVFKADGIYELPFGPGHHWSTRNGFADRVIGGWQISSIHRLQSGRNFLLTSGNVVNNISDRGTFNQYDPGVVLNGITPNQLQSMLGVRKTAGKVFWFPASLIGANGAANPSFIAPCTTAGQLCQRVFLTGPHFYRADFSLAKKTNITERVNFEIRAEALDAFNNINFFFPNDAATSFNLVNVTGTSFGRVTNAFQDPNTTDDNGGRILQLVFRINF